MHIPKNFCVFKTAYLLPINKPWADVITDMIVRGSDEVFKLSEMLPEGWELRATDISGCTGFILEFEIEQIPSQIDLILVDKAIRAFGGNELAKAWFKSV